eukprot:CAMPEP_0175405394 /NCGR_PEP_ID=MMETSP0095-20121207/39028_1 /TAXON_ID=311494 /ORGANISM="Alexandrium monilatum, Strain CCMP3105" /LENGTH=430 /DNA_ID=CAMNT_0016704227 /DNA_START=43 /DNA_END=1333 /DNA_ORIENTATION=-
MRWSQERRELLIKLLAPALEMPPPAPVRVRSRQRALTPELCRSPTWHDLFAGRKHPQPPPMIDVSSGVGGGAELDLLEIRLYELDDELTFSSSPSRRSTSVGTESRDSSSGTSTDSGGRFSDKIMYIDLDQCAPYAKAIEDFLRLPVEKRPAAVWPVQDSQRNCIWKALFERRSILDSTLVIFTDLDEIPTGEAMWALRNCEWRPTAVRYPDIVQLHLVPVPFSLRAIDQPLRDTWVQGTVRKASTFSGRRKELRAGINMETLSFACLRCANTRQMQQAGTHMSYTTNLATFLYKTIQHGEGGNIDAPMLPAPGGGGDVAHVSFCDVSTPEAAEAAQQVLQDYPNNWQHPNMASKSPLPRLPPSRGALGRLPLPWILLENPERYPFFWGAGSLKALRAVGAAAPSEEQPQGAAAALVPAIPAAAAAADAR